MLTTLDNNLGWQDIKRKLEEVCSPIPMEVHTASDLHQKKRLDEALLEYLQNVIDLFKKKQWELMLTLLTVKLYFVYHKPAQHGH